MRYLLWVAGILLVILLCLNPLGLWPFIIPTILYLTVDAKTWPAELRYYRTRRSMK